MMIMMLIAHYFKNSVYIAHCHFIAQHLNSLYCVGGSTRGCGGCTVWTLQEGRTCGISPWGTGGAAACPWGVTWGGCSTNGYIETQHLDQFVNWSTNTEKKHTINGVQLERVSKIKFLGVKIDNKLSWKPHISYIKAKISKSIAILNKAKYLVNQASLFVLYCSFILPYMMYCVEVWGNTSTVKQIHILSSSCKKEPYELYIKLRTENQQINNLSN